MESKTTTEFDTSHLKRTLELAAKGRGKVSPNPLVGAVIVKDDEVIGEGWHDHSGGPHAERAALDSCFEGSAGATMYVSLEPCCHQGKTPPCTDAIVEAGIARVVVASDDPSEKAAGRGLGVLRDEGIDVVMHEGELAAQARLLNQPFRKAARCGRPQIVFKSAMTLDGKVATETGEARWISSEESRALAQRWRAEMDAVCVGIGTALSDDPLLTARIAPVTRQPARVVFDSEARLPLDGKLVATVSDGSVIVVASRAASRAKLERLEAAGVEIVIASGQNEAARVKAGLQALGELSIQSMMLEGGPHLAGSFLDAQEVDEMRLFIAPFAIGGRHAKVLLEGEGSKSLDQGIRALAVDVERLGDDVLVQARMREW